MFGGLQLSPGNYCVYMHVYIPQRMWCFYSHCEQQKTSLLNFECFTCTVVHSVKCTQNDNKRWICTKDVFNIYLRESKTACVLK